LSIVSDTNRFSYNISSKTFEIVKKLFQTKFNYLKLYKKLYVQTLSEIKFLSFIFKNFKIFKNKVGYIILKKEEINFFKIKEEKVSFYLKYFNNNKDFNI
jgi:nanoRNase/pAp phosphatase (c-di-AMP/oligoRNAs hydrolase)